MSFEKKKIKERKEEKWSRRPCIQAYAGKGFARQCWNKTLGKR